jgi:uncharacterized protein
VIIPDINLLVYAYNADAPHHSEARSWWEGALSGARAVGLPWAVILGYLRLMISATVLLRPLEPGQAIAHLRSWLERPQTLVLEPGPRHLDLLGGVLASVPGGELTTDTHLAALAIEHQAELCSNDADFNRFPCLRWSNPLR